jgi:hypothetical protein
MKIHQLSVAYVGHQDRILMRVNTATAQEMRLWLTRRLMLVLWPLLSNLFTKHLLKLESAASSLETADEGLRKMLADFRKEEFLRSADFDTPFQENQAQLPLSEAEPLLVTDVNAAPLPNGRLLLSFNERQSGVEKPRSFQMEMEPKLMQGLMHLLEHALTLSQWSETFGGGPVAVEDCAVEQDPLVARKPRYLN